MENKSKNTKKSTMAFFKEGAETEKKVNQKAYGDEQIKEEPQKKEETREKENYENKQEKIEISDEEKNEEKATGEKNEEIEEKDKYEDLIKKRIGNSEAKAAILVDKDLKNELKIIAIAEGTTMIDITENIIEEFLVKYKKQVKKSKKKIIG